MAQQRNVVWLFAAGVLILALGPGTSVQGATPEKLEQQTPRAGDPAKGRPRPTTTAPEERGAASPTRQPVMLRLPDGVRLSTVPPAEAPANVNLEREQAVSRVLESLVPRAQAMAVRPEVGDEPLREARTNEGWLRSVGAPPGRAFAAVHLGPKDDPAGIAKGFMRLHGEAFGVANEGVGFQAERVKSRNGRQFVRLSQDFSGIPVYGASVVVQLDAAGDVEFVLSDVARDDARFHQKDFATRPVVGADAARALALTVPDLAPQAPDLVASEPVLMIYEPSVIGNAGNSRLVWHSRVTSEALTVDEVVLVDAQTADVALHFSQIMYSLNRAIYDCNSVPGSTGTLARSEGQAATGIADVDDAYAFLGDTYNFYWSHFSRDSIDGAGQTMLARVRYCPAGGPCPWENASWNGVEMKFGLGQAHADDTVGHEFTHGVTSSESGLIYWGEPGAINEAMSDIFGEFVDLGNGAGNDDPSVRWLLFEDAPDLVRRNMKDPTNPPYPGTNSPQPDRRLSPYWFTGYGDNRGVHINSGVGNKLAYLLTDGDTFNDWTVSGMGIDTVAALFYEAQANLLAPGSDYFDMYAVLKQAAINRSWTSAQRANLERACRAVEISYPGTLSTVTNQNFEGSFPPSGWSVSDDSGVGAKWGKDTTFAANGSASAWCAAGGLNAQPLGGYYINNMNTWLVYGPFSLAGVDRAWLEFWVWSHVEANYDYVYMGVSADGTNFSGNVIAASTAHTSLPANWSRELLDFKQVGGVIGQATVWVALVFYSDSSNSAYYGTNIDDVLIVKASCVSPAAPTVTAPSNAASGTDYTVSWSATSPLNTYEIQEDTNPSFSGASTYSGSGTSAVFSHTVGSPTTYYYRVRATDTCGGSTRYSSYSNTGSTTVYPPQTLTVSKAGTGTGTVSSSPPGIDCGSTCSTSLSYGTVVTLSASVGTETVFTGWSGEGCSGTSICQVTMTQARGVTATFTLNKYALTVTKSGTGGGTVTSAPAGITCGSTCSTSFDYNTVVTLSASAGSSSTFTGWSGEGCSGTDTCQVTMTQARSVTATFDFVPSAAALFPITPCRVLDTRNVGGPTGGVALASGQRYVFSVGGVCGIPTDAKSIVANLTAVRADVQGELQVIGGHLTSTSTSALSFPPTRAKANNAIVQLAADDSGKISVINNSTGTVHFILDVNGYFK